MKAAKIFVSFPVVMHRLVIVLLISSAYLTAHLNGDQLALICVSFSFSMHNLYSISLMLLLKA
jgi:hypothetical protein